MKHLIALLYILPLAFSTFLGEGNDLNYRILTLKNVEKLHHNIDLGRKVDIIMPCGEFNAIDETEPLKVMKLIRKRDSGYHECGITLQAKSYGIETVKILTNSKRKYYIHFNVSLSDYNDTLSSDYSSSISRKDVQNQQILVNQVLCYEFTHDLNEKIEFDILKPNTEMGLKSTNKLEKAFKSCFIFSKPGDYEIGYESASGLNNGYDIIKVTN